MHIPLYCGGGTMIMGLSYETMLLYLFILIVVIILIAILATPLKWLGKVLVSSAIGTLALLLFNFIGRFTGFTVGINPYTILTTGILGIPGFLLIIFLKSYFY
jgi:inhibitor of the pro-sigma K processing machinery